MVRNVPFYVFMKLKSQKYEQLNFNSVNDLKLSILKHLPPDKDAGYAKTVATL